MHDKLIGCGKCSRATVLAATGQLGRADGTQYALASRAKVCRLGAPGPHDGPHEPIRAMQFNLPGLSLLLVVGAAQGAEPKAAQRCAAQLQAEQARIERDFTRERPTASDKVAYDRWAKNLHLALNAAGQAAESCERQGQPAPTPESRSALEACISRVASKSEDVHRRYAGRTLSREDQTRLRAEQQELHDQRIACDLASRR